MSERERIQRLRRAMSKVGELAEAPQDATTYDYGKACEEIRGRINELEQAEKNLIAISQVWNEAVKTNFPTYYEETIYDTLRHHTLPPEDQEEEQ